MPDADPVLRISDADREATVARLRRASEEGRLDLGELEERVTAAYAAKTGADLEPLVADLPAEAGAAHAAPRATDDRRRALVLRSVPLLFPNIVCVAIWLATGADGGFWPIWVMLGTGIAFLSLVIRYVTGDDLEHRSRHGS